MFEITYDQTPHENGLSHGESFRKSIGELAGIRKELIRKYFVQDADEKIQRIARDHVEFLKKYPDLYEEFQGISKGANVSEADLMVLNNYTDMRDFGHEEGCSVIAVKTKDRILCGQTWDMHASARPYILRIQIKKPHPTEVLTVAGCLGLAGWRKNGPCVLINNLHCSETHIGLVWPGLVRRMLNQASAKEAVEQIRENLPSSGHNYLICDSQEIYNVETTGKQMVLTHYLKEKEQGAVFHTNHYLSDLRSFEILSRQSKTTHARYDALTQYFDETDLSSLTRETLTQEILAGKKTPAINIKPPENPHSPATCGGISLDLKTQTGEMFAGIYQEKEIRSLK